MSLTSYRAAPPRVVRWQRTDVRCQRVFVFFVWFSLGRRWARMGSGSDLSSDLWHLTSALKAWRRPTLPHLEMQYHWRGGISRPSSGWDRVLEPSPLPPGRRNRGQRTDVRCQKPEGFRGGSGLLLKRVSGFVLPCGFCRWAGRVSEVSDICHLTSDIRFQADRAISKARLHALLRFHMPPIDVVVYHGS